MNTIEPKRALVVLVSLLKRAPLSDAESVGAQTCIDSLNDAINELGVLKSREAERNATDSAQTKDT